MATTKTLNNLVTLNSIVDNEFILVAPNPNTLQTEVLSEIYIHCDTSSQPITIFLPSISTLGYYNAKIYVVDTLGLAGTNNITIVTYEGNTINSATNLIQNTNFESVALSIVSNTQWLGVQSSGSSALPYKVYTALLTQSGGDDLQNQQSGLLTVGVTYYIDDNASFPDFTNVGAPNNNVGTYFVATGTTPTSWGEATLGYNTGAPVVTVLENTIGNVWFTYFDVGSYFINSIGLFTNNKTHLTMQAFLYGPDENRRIGISTNDVNSIQIVTTNGLVPGNDNLYNTSIEIRVYN